MSHDMARPIPVGALVANGGAFAIPVAVSYLFAAIIKVINPSDVDVSSDLAYLGPILIVAGVLLALGVLMAVLMNVTLSRRRNPAASALWVVLGIQIAAIVIIVIAQLWERAVTGA